MFKEFAKKNVNIVTQKPKLVLVVAVLLTILAGVLATGLNIELNWVALAPQGNPAVAEYDKIINDFPALNNVIILVESDDPVAMQQAVLDLENEMSELDEYVVSMTTGLDQDFVLDYGLLLTNSLEAEGMAYALSDANLDAFIVTMGYYLDSMELDVYTTTVVDNFFEAVADNDEVAIREAVRSFYSGNTLVTSENGKMTVLMLQPSFDMMDIKMLEPGVNTIEETIKTVSKAYPTVQMAATGIHIVARDEFASIQSDSSLTTILAVCLILAILYFAFRSFSAPLMAFAPLVLGIIWTVGLTQLVIGRLNMMTAFCAAMLLGLGIDYSIHMYSSYTERRSSGLEKTVALDHAISISGPGIITGALTTAVAFLALNVSQLELLRELGTVMGLGIISTLLSVFWVLPALLTLKKEKEAKILKVKGHYSWIGKVSTAVRKHKIAVIVLLIISSVFMINEARQTEFDLNLMNLEPAGLESIELMNYMVEEYDMSADSFSVTTDDINEVYRQHEAYSKLDGVKEVVSIAAFIPKEAIQEKRMDALKFIDTFEDVDIRPASDVWYLEQLNALNYESEAKNKWIAAIESDGVPESMLINFHDSMSEVSKQMLDIKPLTPNDLPKNYKDQYISKDGSKYLITIYPDFEIWSNLKTNKGDAFFQDIYDVNHNITGTPIFMKVLYESASEEMLTIGALLLGICFVILMIHFRSFKYTVFAIFPLILTMIFTVGTMHLIDLKFNILNFLAILLIIGIGIDDGVHILHHYKMGVRKLEYLFSSVGRAILLTTLTTVCGFGSLIFSSYRGIASLGAALSIGVLYAFIMTIVVLPIVLKEQ